VASLAWTSVGLAPVASGSGGWPVGVPMGRRWGGLQQDPLPGVLMPVLCLPGGLGHPHARASLRGGILWPP
jgi:hypothetical protein